MFLLVAEEDELAVEPLLAGKTLDLVKSIGDSESGSSGFCDVLNRL